MGLNRLFYPKSIAVVGASQTPGGGKIPYFQILRGIGYEGMLYPVNPGYSEIDGLKVYPSLDALPEGIDLAIVAIPVEQSLDIIKVAVRKRIKFVHFFTSGFGEEGNRALERELVKEARRGETRIVGPNCIGIHSSEAKVSFWFIRQNNTSPDVAFFGQSGGTTSSFARLATSRKIGLDKAVSYGNQIDVTAEEYLEYFASDEKVKVIAGYVEDIKNPRLFLERLREATRTKPVVLMKGGMTMQGARAAASHTGALASDHHIWASAVRQHGGILVDTFEQLIDLAMVGVGTNIPRGPRVGFLGAGGGVSVSFTDLAILHGLSVPQLGRETQDRIGRRIRSTNTSTENPVDLGAFGFDFSIMAHTIEAMDGDDGIDVIVPYFSIDYIMRLAPEKREGGPHTIAEVAARARKPIIAVLSRFSEDDVETERLRIEVNSIFREAGIPVFSTILGAIYAISQYLTWSLENPHS